MTSCILLQIRYNTTTPVQSDRHLTTRKVCIPSTGGLGRGSCAPWLAYPLSAGIALDEADSRGIEY